MCFRSLATPLYIIQMCHEVCQDVYIYVCTLQVYRSVTFTFSLYNLQCLSKCQLASSIFRQDNVYYNVCGMFFFCRLTDDRGCVNIHSTTGMFNS